MIFKISAVFLREFALFCGHSVHMFEVIRAFMIVWFAGLGFLDIIDWFLSCFIS